MSAPQVVRHGQSVTSAATTKLSVLVLAGVLVVGVTGGAVAGTVITGADVKNGSLTGKDIKNKSLTGQDLSKRTLGDLEGKPGQRGATGPAGATGRPGADGPAGPGATRLRYSAPLSGSQTLATVEGVTYIGQCVLFLGPAGSGVIGVTLRAEGPGVFRVYGSKIRATGVATTPTLSTMDHPSDQFGNRDIGAAAIVNNGTPTQVASEDGNLILRFSNLSHTVNYRAQVVYANLDSQCMIEGSVIPSS